MIAKGDLSEDFVCKKNQLGSIVYASPPLHSAWSTNMKALRISLILLLSCVLSMPVFAKGSHGGRSSSPHSHSSHASKKSHKSGSHDGQYQGGHGSSHKGGHYKNKKTGDHYRDRKHGTPK
jgi:hypothetical protein